VIVFEPSGELLLLNYESDFGPHDWVARKFKDGEAISLRSCFEFRVGDQLELAMENEVEGDALEFDREDRDEPRAYTFVLGKLNGEYYRLKSRVLGTKNTFYLHRDLDFSPKFFIAPRKISILRKIDRQVSEDVYIGGTLQGAIPEGAYRQLLKVFPSSTELDRYAAARVEVCIREYLGVVGDAERAYHQHMNKKIIPRGSSLLPMFAAAEAAKYKTLLEKLQSMLSSEESYTEAQWQAEILSIIQLLYPKYIRAFESVKIRDTVNKTKRFLDLMLVDASGHIDLIEIKKPFDQCILSRREYRGNFFPAKELSGAVMQLEKYIYYLTKWGNAGERELSEFYRDKLPNGLSLKIVNPKGFIILGREVGMTMRQRADFEIVKRKYQSVIDIISYDDLLDRIQSLLENFSGYGPSQHLNTLTPRNNS
jgi:hypothetical protein